MHCAFACCYSGTPRCRRLREVSYVNALIDKHVLLSEPREPKIVIIGGSNVAFGMDSRVLQEELGRPVVNAGLHAGIGLEYMLRDVEGYLSAGDVLVVIPEYDLLTDPAQGGSRAGDHPGGC